ncbi:hypothetical protein TorRG33x02_316460 [Trema orientale]|uniref:Hydroxyproline-rich glycoprotein family protein n=1 Tax=Trema orientale TaxID=63057 RepID=A0A2P5BLN2_TREOI|nr:hypothetical protein TorRG33x02_316460 [Trema orientale]
MRSSLLLQGALLGLWLCMFAVSFSHVSSEATEIKEEDTFLPPKRAYFKRHHGFFHHPIPGFKKPLPQPVPIHKPEPKPEAKPKPKSESKPKPKAESKPKPKPKSESKPKPKLESKPKPKSEPKPEPKPIIPIYKPHPHPFFKKPLFHHPIFKKPLPP